MLAVVTAGVVVDEGTERTDRRRMMCGNARAGRQAAAATLCAARLGASGTPRHANMHTPPPRGYSNATAKFVSDFAELRLPISLGRYMRIKLVVVMNSMWYL